MDIDDAVEMLKNYPKFHKYLMNLFLKDQILSDQFCVLRDTRDTPEYPYLSEDYLPLINAGYMDDSYQITHSGYKALDVLGVY